MKIKIKDWTELLDLYPESKGFEYTQDVKIVLNKIMSAYRYLDIQTDQIFLTSDEFPEILIEENVVRFFLYLHRNKIIEDLFLPITVERGPGTWFTTRRTLMEEPSHAFLEALKKPKEFKKKFVSFRITDREAFINFWNTAVAAFGIKPKVPAIIDNKLAFDSETGTLSYQGESVDVPIKTNQFYLCKKMFEEPVGKRVNEIDIMSMIDWSKDSNRGVYDAVQLVNKRVEKHLGIPKLFKWRMNTAWREQ